jgi:hypothetical protein
MTKGCQRGCLKVLLSLALIATPASGQWLKYPTPAFPKTPSGLPNLGAPTPRTADGKPDFSGTWEAENTIRTAFPIGPQFLDISSGLEGGLPYQPWAAELAKARRADNSKDDPDTRCLPISIVRTFTYPTLKKIVQVPGLIVMLDEHNASYRQIFTDGRPMPTDPQPSWNGYSTGKWEEDTLVVDTAGFRDGIWLDERNGSPMTDAAKLTERIRRVNYGNMEILVTIDDPKAYNRPWTVKLNQFIVLNTDLLDYICLENEKDIPHLVGK